ncbi:hypothetical protein PR048_027998 [Dryococelus australis]|uniref:DDE-1 domain-containing protein n=1 Tax=Dryococelus australis TaxID=614101 RepID=A0ABQ9GI03_9NEOP|nr:hypothetical protein PR048_027998 [Dryococelus australis]
MGKRQVSRIASADRGSSASAVMCICCLSFIPPMLIFRLQNSVSLRNGLITFWPTQSQQHMFDGHLSHTKNLTVIIKARENFVTIIRLPPHTSHKLQPFDVGHYFLRGIPNGMLLCHRRILKHRNPPI